MDLVAPLSQKSVAAPRYHLVVGCDPRAIGPGLLPPDPHFSAAYHMRYKAARYGPCLLALLLRPIEPASELCGGERVLKVACARVELSAAFTWDPCRGHLERYRHNQQAARWPSLPLQLANEGACTCVAQVLENLRARHQVEARRKL